jgi:TRAP-type uncharacterized transport system fused permease subunit
VFVLDPDGVGLLLKAPADHSWLHVAWIGLTACLGIAALAAGTQKWLLGACNQFERIVLIVSGLLLVYPASAADVFGIAGLAVVAASQWLSRRRMAAQHPVAKE